MTEPKIQLGMEVKDSITGFKGIVVCIANWLHGCRRIGIQSRELDKENKPQESVFFDEGGIRILGQGVMSKADWEAAMPSAPEKTRGGPNREIPGQEHY